MLADRLTRELSRSSPAARENELEKDRLIASYGAAYGRIPSEKTIVELRARATLATRPPKEMRSLADLTAEWRRWAVERVRGDPTTWAATILDRNAAS